MAIQESGEMYLETILILSEKMDAVHAIDIVKEMGFSKPSVSRAMGLLRDEGLLKKDTGNILKLTEAGIDVSNDIMADLLLEEEAPEEPEFPGPDSFPPF